MDTIRSAASISKDNENGRAANLPLGILATKRISKDVTEISWGLDPDTERADLSSSESK